MKQFKLFIVFSCLFGVFHFSSAQEKIGPSYAQFPQIDSCYNESTICRDTLEALNCLISLEETFLKERNTSLFLETINRAKKLTTSPRFLLQRLNLYYHEGIFYEQTGLYNKALEKYLFVYERKDSLPDDSKYQLITNIGGIYGVTHNVEQSKKLHKEALNLAIREQDSLRIGISTGNIGVAYMNLKNYDSAKYYIQQSIQYNKLEKDKISISYYNISTLYLFMDSADKSLEAIKKAMSYFPEDTISLTQGYNFWHLGGVYEYSYNKLKEAESCFKRAYNIGKELMDLQLLRKSTVNLAYLYEKKGDYRQALKYIKEGKELADSVGFASMDEKVNRLRIQHETELKERESEKYRLELQVKEEQLKRENQRFRSILITGVLTILFLLFFIYFLRQKNKTKNLKIKLYQKEEKIKEERISLSQLKIEDLKQTILEKNLLIKELNDNNSSAFKEAKANKRLVSTLSNEKNWARFMIEFRILHKEFFNKLREINPKLTSKDLRLAALIKLHLLDKELADLLNIEPSSVRMSKNRLKSKLELSKEQSLISFFESL